MREQALYPKRAAVTEQDRRASGVVMGRVTSLDRDENKNATGTMTVETVDGGQVYKATMMAAHANTSSGWLWLPQEGDLVVLAFLQGHKSLPVVLGCLYQTKDEPPTTDPDVLEIKHQSGTVLRVEQNGDVHLTHKTGAVIDVEDQHVNLESESGKLEILATGDIQFTHPNGSNVRLDETKISINSDEGSIIEVDAGSGAIRLQNSGGNRIRVENSQIVIQDGAGNNLTLDSTTGKITVSVSGDIELGGNTSVVLDGDITGPQIGSGSGHHHVVNASAVKLKGG